MEYDEGTEIGPRYRYAKMPQPYSPLLRLALAFVAAGMVLSPTLAAPPTTCWIANTVFDLGEYDPSVPPPPLDASLILECTNQGARVEVRMNAGLYGTFSERQMANGADRLGYNIYLPDGSIWGEGTASLPEAKRTYPAPLPIRLQIRAGQWVPAGTYTDTITVTLIF